MIRFGLGYDVHQLVKDRPLILGGLPISFEMGLLGHSDADVLTHAIMDAMLGALALGDIGTHFPDTDPKYKGADSFVLLDQVMQMIRDQGYELGNIDATVVAQRPKLNPYILNIRQSLADRLAVSIDRISIKATTSETMGFVGREEGMATHALAMLMPIQA